MTETLYSWGNPLSFAKFLDHTWVTNYAMVPDQPTGSDYWYCWGIQHDTYRAQLSEGAGNGALANEIAPANTPPHGSEGKEYQPSDTSGAIVYYGLDGVCHQVANELLTATATPTQEPARIKEAHGYPLSTFFFGTYGLNDAGWDKIVADHLAGLKLGGDDFIPILDAAVPQEKRQGVLDIRTKVQAKIRAIRARVDAEDFDFYADLAAVTTEALSDLYLHLGSDEFIALFPSLDFDAGDHKNSDWLKSEFSQMS